MGRGADRERGASVSAMLLAYGTFLARAASLELPQSHRDNDDRWRPRRTSADIALALEGTTEAPHFDRRAFKAQRIFATLAPDGLTANLRFPPEEQEFRCETQPDAYRHDPEQMG